MSKSDNGKLLKTTFLVTAVIILSKICGLARDVMTAGYFGTGIENDAYASAYTLFYLPVLLFNSCITATIVPMYTKEREQYSLQHSNRFASNALNLFCATALVVSVLMYVFAKPIVCLIYKFDEAGIALTVRMTRIMMVGLVFNIASIVFSSLLNAMEKFIAAQLTGFPLSLCVMISVFLFSDKLGVEAITWGVLAASVLQALIQIPFMVGWFNYSFVFDIRDKRIHHLLKLAGPAMLSMGISEINHLIDRSLASGLATGSISAMNYAYKLITFLLGVLMVPLTTIMFSRMSRQAASHDEEGVVTSLKRSMTIILSAALPIIAIAMVLSNDVIKLIFMRGNFTIESVKITGSVLLFYLIGVPSFGLRDFMNRTFHALQDTKTPFIVACLVVLMNITLNLILRIFLGARGLALATSISSYIGLTAMLLLLKKRMGRLNMKEILPELIKLVIAAASAAAVCMLMNKLLPEAMTTVSVLIRLIVATAVSFACYLALCLILKVNSIRELAGIFLARLKRTKKEN